MRYVPGKEPPLKPKFHRQQNETWGGTRQVVEFGAQRQLPTLKTESTRFYLAEEHDSFT
jgi:hypothetical protein